MKRTVFLLLSALVLGMTVTSCNVEEQLEKISVDGFEDVKVNGVTANRIGLDFYLTVSNFSNKNLQLRSGYVDVFSEGTKLYTIRVKEPVKVAKRTQGTVMIPVIAEFTSPFGVMGMMPYMSKYEGFVMNAEFTFSAGAMRKTYREDGIPLRAVMGDMDIDLFQLLMEQMGS